MDTKHRHELEENDLLDFFTNFKDWWTKHGNKLLLVVLVILVGILGYRLIHQRALDAREAAWRDLNQATSPAALRNLAENSSDPNYQAYAYLRGGDLLRERAMQAGGASLGPDSAKATPATKPAEREENLRSAESMYKHVINLDKAHPVYKANARLALARVHEDLARLAPDPAQAQAHWAAAKEQEDLVVKETGGNYSVLAAQATTSEALIPRLQKPIVFAPETQPATQPANAEAAPATQPGK